MYSEISLLYPEWQGYGENNLAYLGALTVARSLFDEDEFISIGVPAEENLVRRDKVLGLDSIAPRFQEARQILELLAPHKILTVGGTCAVELAPVGYLNELYRGDLAVVWLDAHGDLNTPDSSPSGHFHGMALRALLGEGVAELCDGLKRFLTPEQIFLAGTRELDPPEAEFCAEKAILITTTDEFSAPQILVEKIRQRGFKNLYLHFDLDAVNVESYPNSLMQTRNGPPIEAVQAMIKSLAENFETVGFSVLEYCERGAKLEILANLLHRSGIKIGALRNLN